MTQRKRTEVMVETDEVLIIRRPGKAVFARCPRCAGQAGMVPPDEAAVLAGVSPRTVYQWVEAGELHFTEGPDGVLLICLNSLAVRHP